MTGITFAALIMAVLCLTAQTILIIHYIESDTLKFICGILGVFILMFTMAGYGRSIMEARANIYGDNFFNMSNNEQVDILESWQAYLNKYRNMYEGNHDKAKDKVDQQSYKNRRLKGI